MTAAPASGSFTQVDQAHVAAVGPAAALLFSRICWRAELTGGSWQASRAVLAQETGLSLSVIRGAVNVLREREWLHSEPVSPTDATLVWTPLLPPAESAIPPLRNLPHPPAESAISSTQTVDTTTDPPAAAAAVQEAPGMTVPDSYQDALLPTVAAESAGPPKSAQTLVARWCDGYRESNGHDAPTPLTRRVAGQMKNLARACGESHTDWVAAYAAAYDCGRAGRWDPVGFMSRRQHTARTTNAFVAPELGGPGGRAVTAMQGLLAQTPQLGARS